MLHIQYDHTNLSVRLSVTMDYYQRWRSVDKPQSVYPETAAYSWIYREQLDLFVSRSGAWERFGSRAGPLRGERAKEQEVEPSCSRMVTDIQNSCAILRPEFDAGLPNVRGSVGDAAATLGNDLFASQQWVNCWVCQSSSQQHVMYGRIYHEDTPLRVVQPQHQWWLTSRNNGAVRLFPQHV